MTSNLVKLTSKIGKVTSKSSKVTSKKESHIKKVILKALQEEIYTYIRRKIPEPG